MSSTGFATILNKKNIGEKELLLLKIYADKEVNIRDYEKLFKLTNFEQENYQYNLMLTKLGTKHGWDNIPERLVPRLKGVSLKENSKTTTKIARCFNYFNSLNENSIEFVVLKGAALKLHYLNEYIRKISDIDILVSEENYDIANKIAIQHGFERKSLTHEELHSTDYKLDSKGALDIHKRVFKCNVLKKENSDWIFNNSNTIEKNGVRIKLPKIEFVYLNILINGLDNLISDVNRYYSAFFITDLIDIKEKFKLDYHCLKELLDSYNIKNRYCVAIDLINSILPNYFNEETELKNIISHKKNITHKWIKLLNGLYSYRKYGTLIGKICRGFKYNWNFCSIMYTFENFLLNRIMVFLKAIKDKYKLNSMKNCFKILSEYIKKEKKSDKN